MRTRMTAALVAVLAGPSSGNTAEIVALIAAAAVLIGVVVLATRRRFSSRSGRGSGRRFGRGHSPSPGQSTAELEALAGRALVDTDDAVRTSDQELGFAIARFGEHASAPFSAALKAARGQLGEAFRLRQLLDDDEPGPGAVKRATLTEITDHCGEASRLLDEQAEAFDRLQDLEARAPEVLAEVDHHVTQQAARLSESEQTLGQLTARYTAGAVTTVTSSPDEARERLDFARTGVADAQQALAAGLSGEAAVYLQAAESAADQAEALLDGIEHLQAELIQAASALAAALREIDVEVTEAAALLAGKPDDRAAVIHRARAAAADVRDQVAAGSPFDALAALRQLAEADASLDHALDLIRDEPDRRHRARAVLDQAMLVARSSITAAEDFITTRRGGVEAPARTRLAESHRHFRQAIVVAQDDPEKAVGEAQHADALARQARSLAEHDVAAFCSRQPEPLVRVGGTGGSAGVSGAGSGGAILGGILIDSMAAGRGDRAAPDGFGTPGSFGGIGTRGRHSVGRVPRTRPAMPPARPTA